MCIVGRKSYENSKDKVIFLLENYVKIWWKCGWDFTTFYLRTYPIRQIGQVESIGNLFLNVWYNVVQLGNLQHESILLSSMFFHVLK